MQVLHRLVAVVGVGALGSAGLLGCSAGGDAPPSEIGTIVSLDAGMVGGAQRVLQLPDRQVLVTADDLGESLPAEVAAGTGERSAGAGRRWIGIAWDSSPGAGVPGWLQTLVTQTEGPETDTLDATLVVGDERVPVGSPTSDAVTKDGANTLPVFAVAVPAEGALSLDVDFSGVTQTLDLATGQQESRTADALADLPEQQPAGTPCGGSWTVEGTLAGAALSGVVCNQLVVRLPYVVGLGWADDATRPWVVLHETTNLGSELEDGGATYEIGDARDATYLDGQAPARKILDETQAGAWSVISAYAPSDPGTLELAGRVALTRTSGDGSDSVQVTVTAPEVVSVPPTG